MELPIILNCTKEASMAIDQLQNRSSCPFVIYDNFAE
jgi:hypothetical protein